MILVAAVIAAAAPAILFVPDKMIGSDVILAVAGIYFVLFVSYSIAKSRGIVKSEMFAVIYRDSFGLYLFHAMINYAVLYMFRTSAANPYFICALSFVVSTAGAIGITELLRRSHLYFAIGERGEKSK